MRESQFVYPFLAWPSRLWLGLQRTLRIAFQAYFRGALKFGRVLAALKNREYLLLAIVCESAVAILSFVPLNDHAVGETWLQDRMAAFLLHGLTLKAALNANPLATLLLRRISIQNFGLGRRPRVKRILALSLGLCC